MQFTLNIIAALLAVSTSTVVADLGCDVASGSWPAGDQELNKGDGQSQPFVTCFSTGVPPPTGFHHLQCWTRSHYIGSGYYAMCVPAGYDSRLWEIANPKGWRVKGETASCDGPCNSVEPY